MRGLQGGFNARATISVRGCAVGRKRVINLINGGKTKGAALFHLVLSLLGTSANRVVVGSVRIGRDRS